MLEKKYVLYDNGFIKLIGKQIIDYTNFQSNLSYVINTNINYTAATQHHIHCNSINYCIVALTISDGFIVYQINLIDNSYNLIRQYSYNGRFIQCDSFSSTKFFCIFGII